MDAQLRTQVAFHLTATRSEELAEPSEWLDVRPALLAGYRDLASLRYDFPLVLVGGAAEAACVRSLSGLVDGILQKIAPRGVEGERTRRHVLRLEQEIRRRTAAGRTAALSELWREAADHLLRQPVGGLEDSLNRARAALDVDGDVVDCDADMPVRLTTHAWRCVQEQKIQDLREEIDRLVLKLSDILQADFVRSEAGRSAASLKATVGPVLAEAFDFEAMSRILAPASAASSLSAKRRRRINNVLSALRSQPFLAAATKNNGASRSHALDPFVFDSCSAALEAFRQRLPAITDFVKAVAIAELEIEGRYVEQEHDRLFAAFDEKSLGRDELAKFPDYLVCIRSTPVRGDATAGIMDVLTSGLPAKVLVQTDDILGAPSIGDGASGQGGARLATMAIGLDDVYVVQSASSNLYALREQMLKGLAYRGATLVSVFSGASGETELPPYLSAAAAMQSRAFPAFTYDPSAGSDLPTRFTLATNPAPETDWTETDFIYEDAEHQRVAQSLAFTYVDFLSSDHRYERHFARVPQAKWTASMRPLTEWMATGAKGFPDHVPYIVLVDGNHVVEGAIVDAAAIAAARRCLELWHRLQELGGLRGPLAERARPPETPQAQGKADTAAVASSRPAPALAAPAAAAPAAAAPAAAVAAAAEGAASAATAEAERPSDVPYIETLRCTSCNECTQINNRMFAYDENKQAYIANADAGTYRQLVEAAESCQVSIIHPGLPRNPNEPGLEELLKRAEPFR